MKFTLVPPVESFPVKNYPTLKPLQATLCKLLTHCVLSPTQPPTRKGRRKCLVLVKNYIRINKNLAIANRSRVSCAHNSSRASP